MTSQPVEGTCVEHLHDHVGQCYRRGLADGYAQGVADHEAALRALAAVKAVERLAEWCEVQVTGESFRPRDIAISIRAALASAPPAESEAGT